MRKQVLNPSPTRDLIASLQAEEGLTLVELLVTIIAGLAILVALFTIQATTLHQMTRQFSKLDSTEHAETGVEQIENELHSACVADNVTPIQTGSTATSLMFVSQYGTAASLTPVEHIVTYSSAARTLTDATYAETGVTENSNDAPVYTFASSPTSTRTVLTNVTQTGSIPVFQYYSYSELTNPATGSAYSAPDGNPYMVLPDGTDEIPGTSTLATAPSLSVPLSSTNASNTAEVLITMTVGPAGGSDENTNQSSGGESFSDVDDSVEDGVVLRMTPAANELSDGTVFLPCQ
jgi:hypothetical protein